MQHVIPCLLGSKFPWSLSTVYGDGSMCSARELHSLILKWLSYLLP